MLHLLHRALALAVLAVERLRDDAVEAGALEPVEPLGRERTVGRGRREEHWRLGLLERALEARASLLERLATQIVVALREQVERDERRRCFRRELLDARRGRMDPERQQIEVETMVGGDHDLAVDDGALREVLPKWIDQVGEVARERALVAAADLDVVTVAEHDGTEAVPLRLVEVVAGRELTRELRQHRRNRRGHREGHANGLVRACDVGDEVGLVLGGRHGAVGA